MAHPRSRRRTAALAAAVAALAAAVGCQAGPPTVFGYQLGADALYDTNIRTVYVPVFHNRAFQTTPYRGLEVDITRAVVREIGRTTRFRVVSDPDRADTELKGVVVDITKVVQNRNQQNLTREADLLITVDVIWRDLRSGCVLSNPRPAAPPVPGGLPPQVIVPFDPDVPVPPPVTQPDLPQPVRVVASGRMIPELGESNATASQMAVNRLAVQIVSLMEKPW